jgi:hypothetical protein
MIHMRNYRAATVFAISRQAAVQRVFIAGQTFLPQNPPMGSRSRIQMEPKQLKVCNTHEMDLKGDCLSCQVAVDWNVYRQFCWCGQPATGYHVKQQSAPVEFTCDEHFYASLPVEPPLTQEEERKPDLSAAKREEGGDAT